MPLLSTIGAGSAKGFLKKPVVIADPGEAEFNIGSHIWTVPPNVTSVSVVAIGGGGSNSNTTWSSAGGGGALAYKNDISVVPGQKYTVVVGRRGERGVAGGGGNSYFVDLSTVAAGGGETSETNLGAFNKPGGTVIAGDGGGTGGRGGYYDSGFTGYVGGGGGAGGYSGDGGDGGTNASGHSVQVSSGTGGAGGGGWAVQGQIASTHGGGGGVFPYGEGASGSAGTSSSVGGKGGSGGTDGASGGNAGQFGGGAGGYGDAQMGRVRIVWPGDQRQFPSTYVNVNSSDGNTTLYQDTGITWGSELTISNPDVEPSDPNDGFGRAIDISDDYVVAGATSEDLAGTNAGAAYVFDLSGNLLYTLQNPDPLVTGAFGVSIAVDGNYIVVGDYNYNSNGRVYVYDITTFGSVGSTITSANYTLTSFTTAPDGTTQSGSSWFGWSVAIDDGWVVVGAPAATHASQGSHGAAYLYDISTFSTSSITSATYVIANPNVPSGTADRMGYSVAIDGKWIAVGIPGAEDNPKTYEGAVYVWDKSTFGAAGTQPSHTWEFVNQNTQSYFTRGNTPHIAISEKTGIVLIGHYFYTGANNYQGRAYVGDLSTGNLIATIESPNPVTDGYFGQGVALSSNGTYAHIVQEHNGGSSAAVYSFDVSNVILSGVVLKSTTTMGSNRPWAVAGSIDRFVVANNPIYAPQLITQHYINQ